MSQRYVFLGTLAISVFMLGCRLGDNQISGSISGDPNALLPPSITTHFNLNLSGIVAGSEGSSDGLAYDALDGWIGLEQSPSIPSSYPLNSSWINTTGLAAYWRLDQGSDGLVGNNASVQDVLGLTPGLSKDGDATLTCESAQVDRGMVFDGVNDYIEVANTAQIEITGDQLTVMGWIWVDPSVTTDLALLCKGPSVNNETYMLGIDNGAQFNFRTTTTVGGYKRMDVGTITKGQWTHVAGTYNGSEMVYYADGKKIASLSQTGSLVNDGSPLYIGKRCVGDLRYWKGKLDEASVWSRALTASEIKLVYDRQGKLYGEFRSPVLNAGGSLNWQILSWEPEAPYGKELPNNQTTETGYSSGNVSMTGNVLLYHLNETGTPTTFVDDSGGTSTVHTGSCTGTCPTVSNQGAFGGAMAFDGTQYLEIPHHSDFDLSEGTVSVWVKVTGSGGTYGIVSKDSSGFDTGGHFDLKVVPNSEVRLRIQSSTADNTITTNCTPLSLNSWHHVAASFGAAGMKLYVDGQPLATDPYSGGLDASSGGAGNFEPWAIGASTIGSGDGTVTPVSNPLEGQIDELAIWNRQMADAEVLNLYKRGAYRVQFQVRACTQSDCSDNSSFIGFDGSSSTFWSEFVNSSMLFPSLDMGPLNQTSRYFQLQGWFESRIPGSSPRLRNFKIGGSQ
ncbi:MAG: LamG domain-containing protein [Bdellovibrionaceae bacterium]|nr:LamG domain-containing protein [Bdellovibrionales bacterium]MCB9085193.1 LamG domain-containing protein [Pseudobdellovibrionaceae bacterium]